MIQPPTASVQSSELEQGVLSMLRSLIPRRALTPSEAFRLAELQANRLLHHFEVDSEAVPEEIVSELPRILVKRVHGLLVSGAAHWNGTDWVLTINADEPISRQRFSVMHEFKHVIDHPRRHRLYRPSRTADELAERVADYFAACVLMPKRTVKRLWFGGDQSIDKLARRMHVSSPALRYRLDQLGLTETSGRCGTRTKSFEVPR